LQQSLQTTGKEDEMTTDPVCGMSVNEKTAPAKTEYQGKTYYFCSTEDKRKFEEQPANYTKKEPVSTR
jgi:P-type Cu+ transporter